METISGPDATPSSSLVLSTTALPARDRLPVWRDVFGRTMVRLDIEPVKGTSFHAEGTLLSLPGAAFASVTTTPVRVSRTQELIAADMADMMFLIIADTPLHIVQSGREQFLEAGDAIFVRGSERSVIQSRDRTRFVNISVPADDLMPSAGDRRDPSMTMVSRQSDPLGLLLGYVRLLQTRREPLPDEVGCIAAAHIRDLMAAMIGAGPEREPLLPERGGVRAARLKAIKADIGERICEPGLCIDGVAARHGISPRYVRKLFHEEETTFSEYVLALRLEHSRQLLGGPATGTIASIAHACGFGDLSYFNRTFRRRYGITPSDLRNGDRTSCMLSVRTVV